MMQRMGRNYRHIGMGAARALLLLCGAGIFTCDVHAATPAPNSQPASIGTVPQFAIADFDGDSRPDVATVQVGESAARASHYSIRFQLSTGLFSHDIDLTAPTGGLDISSRDVNGDNFLDVIVTSALSKRPIAVLLNDGHGNFTTSDPSVFPDAFQDSHKSWSGSASAMHDSSPALLSRLCSEYIEVGCSSTLSPKETQLRYAYLRQVQVLSGGVSFLGRAPPTRYKFPL